MDQTPSPRINTNSLIQCYPTFQRTGQTQIIDGCIFLSMSDYDKLMLHHGTATWVDCKVDGKGHKPSKFNDFIRDPKKFVFLEKHIGQKADKKRKVYNGMIKCNIYQYFDKMHKIK